MVDDVNTNSITETGKKILLEKLSEWNFLNNLIKSCREGFSCMNLELT
jgi:hypothetical protein